MGLFWAFCVLQAFPEGASRDKEIQNYLYKSVILVRFYNLLIISVLRIAPESLKITAAVFSKSRCGNFKIPLRYFPKGAAVISGSAKKVYKWKGSPPPPPLPTEEQGTALPSLRDVATFSCHSQVPSFAHNGEGRYREGWMQREGTTPLFA